jgi:TonB-linked SusC/RagA family outer membrane protein
MRKILNYAFTLIGMLLLCFSSFAQERQVNGRVTTSDDSKPLAGVTVTIKGTRKATKTDDRGNFNIVAKPGDVLQFSYTGRKPNEIRLQNQSTIDLQLTPQDNVLTEVVVTAMDVRRNPRELGYSTQTVKGAELAETQRENFINSLQGRVAGATINPTTGDAGASSQIVLRGFNSMALSNSPLFVIDGIIVDNSTLNENDAVGFGARSNENRQDYTNRISDINPNDIESITVLKGPEATALYGSQASSGAIIITTRKAVNSTGHVAVAYDNSFRLQKTTRFTEFQRNFQSGTNGVYAATFSYFGPAVDASTPIYPNKFEDFLKTGFAQTHNLGIDFGKKNASFRFSGSLFDQSGTIPANTYSKYNARLSNNTRIGSWLEIQPSISYIRSANSKPLRGAGGYMLSFFSWPGQYDVTNWQDENGFKKPLFSASPNDEIDNPYYNVYRNRNQDKTDRVIGTLGINLTPYKWLTVSGRFGYDTYATDGFYQYDSMSNYVVRSNKGALNNYFRRYYGYNHTITATAKHTIGDFSGRIMIGNMWQDYETKMTTVYGTNLVSQSRSDTNNTDVTTRIRNVNMFRKGLPNESISRQAAYFAEAGLGWKNAVFLTYSHRFEESSIFPKQFRNYNYPAASLSIMLSDLVTKLKSSKVLDYWKIRGSLASTARSGSPYSNQSVFGQATSSGGGWTYGITNANEFLKPERQQTYEFGTEFRFFGSRLTLDATYYNTKNKDLIVEGFRASYGTGFILNTLNVGSNKNTGIEIALEAVPVQTNNFRWSTRFNFNKMKNEVTSLPDNVPEFYISDTWFISNANIRGGLIVGGPTTAITGYGYTRTDKGDILINPTSGLPISNQVFKVLGDRNPDFTLGNLHNFSYKNLRVSMLWDLKIGGDVVNGNEYYLTRNGRSLRTADRLTPRIVKGVLNDGLQNTANPTVNTIVVTPFYNQTFYSTGMPEEEFVEKDVNWLRLRDLTLNYSFSPNVLKSVKFVRSLSAFVTGNDLILITNYTGADPAVNGTSPGSRGVGAFAFDYGSVPTPISLNFGIKANF